MEFNKEERELLKEFNATQDRLKHQLLLIKWLCDERPELSKYMHVMTGLFNKRFTTKSLPLKNSRAHELIKEWGKIGLIKRVDTGDKLHVYTYNPTLFVKVIDNQLLKEDVKKLLNRIIDEILEVQ